MEEKIKELAQNEEFCEKLAATESAEEAVKLFAEEGVEVTAEELTAAFAEIPAGELDESTLENVAGGYIKIGSWWPIKPIWPKRPKKPKKLFR